MKDFDYKKFMAADEQTQRTVITDVTGLYTIKGSHTADFRILAFELRDKVDYRKYELAVYQVVSLRDGLLLDIKPIEMIAASLMAWPGKENEE